MSKQPNIQLSLLAKDDNLARFLDAFEWFLAEIRNSGVPAQEAVASPDEPR